ncbi:MAG: prepilin peptidase [Patescibacteria group bacterium]
MTEQIIAIVFAALFGAIFGSFENVLILRWHEEVSIMGRSHCPACKKQIKWMYLIPIVSWLALHGKCAECDAGISIQYPLVEAAAVILAIIAAVRHDPFLDPTMFTFEFLVTVGLIVPVVMDIRWKELPLEYLIGLASLAFMFRILIIHPLTTSASTIALGYDALAVVGLFAFFGLQVAISREKWVGSGDAWFGVLMGAILGWPNALFGLYGAYIMGGSVAIAGLALGKLKRGDRVPFAPALAAGTLLALWYGAPILAFFFT